MMGINSNTDIYDKKLNRAAMIRLFENKVTGTLMVEYDGHIERLDTLIRKSKVRSNFSKDFYEALDKELVKTFGNMKNISERHLIDLVQDQTSFTANVFSDTVGKIWTVKRPQRRIAEEIVLKLPLYKNQTLAQGWTGIALNEKKRLEGIIRKGISEGLDEQKIADLVYNSSFHKITKQQSLGLARTGITSVVAQADHEVYKANENLLDGWQYIAVLDSRTTPLCAHRDGMVYPVSDTEHLPPAHWHCRSSTVPVVKNYEDLSKLEGISYIRKRNFAGLSDKQIAYYDGQTALGETYNDWLLRQPTEIQLKHLGDYQKLELFRSQQLTLDKFTDDGVEISIKELRALSDGGYGIPGDTRKFAIAKDKLDALKLGAVRPEDLYADTKLVDNLREYYLMQTKDLDGTLSLVNYRGINIGNKKLTKQRVLTTPPSEKNLRFNPLTGRYDDSRLYSPHPLILENQLRLVRSSTILKQADKDFIEKFINSFDGHLGVNERAVISDNLRIIFTRFRENKEPWTNLKAVIQSQIKFDIMNISDSIETQLRKDSDFLKKLAQDTFLDPVLGSTQLKSIHDNLIDNIYYINKWEDRTAPKIARELRNILDYKIAKNHPIIWKRLSEFDLEEFYLKFAKRLSLADSPDRDQLAVSLGRDLFNLANYRGSRREWYEAGRIILDDAKDKGLFVLDSYGVQKRRMKSRLGNHYFGPYYDTEMVFLRITDKRIVNYAKKIREVDVGLRVSNITDKPRLVIREGYKTYFIKQPIGWYDTRIPITSTDSFSDFPATLIDKEMADALNWAGSTKYKVDKDFHDFIEKLLYFKDDKGRSKYFDELNNYRSYIVERGDSYERFKVMKWYRDNDYSFSNVPFLDHRARIYERGFLGPQSGEAFRPFLNTPIGKNFSELDFYNLQDQVGAFVGGLSDSLEGPYNSLSVIGRQKIAEMWRPELVKVGKHILRAKPDDIRAVLESKLVQSVDGEDQGKLLRLALEIAKIDNHLKGNYSKTNLVNLKNYKIFVALEQDASSSGAQIIALTTRNKALAELSNVIPTNQKKRLYDEIAAATFNDARFKKLNVKLGLTEKDLRKAAKAQNMVTFYGAGEKTGALNVETKLAKALDKNENLLVIKASERDIILNEISARMARYEKLDPDIYLELKALRQDIRDIFNKGLPIGDDIVEQLYFLDSKTKDILEKLSRNQLKTVTPDDFSEIASIMSEHLREQVPILKDFTKYFGRLAESYLINAKPANSSLDVAEIIKVAVFDSRREKRLPKFITRLFGLRDETIRDKLLRRFKLWDEDSLIDTIIFGAKSPKYRRTGFKFGGYSIYSEDIIKGSEVLYPNKLPKSWTNIPWVNFDGKILEQNFTQSFEERLLYKEGDKWINSLIQVKQKTDPTWWEEFRNKSGKIFEIADIQKARTAYAVNGVIAVIKLREFGEQPFIRSIPSQVKSGVTTIM